jgi:hypothetical protein
MMKPKKGHAQTHLVLDKALSREQRECTLAYMRIAS